MSSLKQYLIDEQLNVFNCSSAAKNRSDSDYDEIGSLCAIIIIVVVLTAILLECFLELIIRSHNNGIKYIENYFTGLLETNSFLVIFG